MKKVLASLTLASALMLGSQSAFAATALCYYDTNSKYSSIFANTDGTVVINGWQTNDAPLRITPSVTYTVCTHNYFGSDNDWASQPVVWDYPQSGGWYSYTLSGIPSRNDLSMKVTVNSSYNTRGAGNAY